MTTAQLIGMLIAGFGIFLTLGTLIFKAGRWVGGINKTLNAHGSLLDEIRGDIKRLFGRLPAPAVEGNSPLRPSALGRKVAEDIGAATWATKMATSLLERVSGMEPYEINELCFEFLYDKYQPDSELDTAIRKAAYEHSIDRYAVLDVLAVLLRDELLSLTAVPEKTPS